MSEFEQLVNESFKTIRNGEVVKGTVLTVKENEIVVNIGYKHDGLLRKEDFTSDPEAVLADLVQVGDEIEAKVVKVNDGDGNVILSKRKNRVEKTSQVLEDAFNNKTVVTATVDEAVKGGLSLTVDECKVFIPASLVAERFIKDLSSFQGKEISFVVTEYDPKKHRIIGDRKQLLVAEREAAVQAVLDNVHAGDVINGKIKSVTEFGAFVEVGSADGLLHISEMSWGHIGNPKKVFKVGDEVTVYVKEITETTDKAGNKSVKISLSKKFPDQNPWANAETKYAVGNVVTGKVARLTDFGAFVQLEENVDGLVHVSQISYERVEKASDVLTEGQEVTVKVTGIDLEAKKISLSIKELLPKPERPERPQRSRKNNRNEEANLYNADGTLNIEAFGAKVERDEAAKEAKAAEEAAEAAQTEE